MSDMSADDIATTCDGCGSPIPYGVTCYSVWTGEWYGSVWTGEWYEGSPVVRIECSDCYHGPAIGTPPIKAVNLPGDVYSP